MISVLKIKITLISEACYLSRMDLIGPLNLTLKGSRYIPTVVDYFTKWVEAVAISRKDAVTVEPNFNGTYGIKHSFTRCCTPNANGMVERYNETLQRYTKVNGGLQFCQSPCKLV